MSNKKVYYFGIDCPGDSLVRQTVNEDYVYSKCPVYQHRQNRIFVAYSPIDFEVKVERTPGSGDNYITCEDPDLLEFDDEYLHGPKPVLQLKTATFLFWTEDDDVWFEFYDHPMTALKNNFIAVGGLFNLSNWTRTSSLAFTIVDETKPVVIKKGDPLCRICFHSPNLGDGIVLKEEKSSKIIKEVTSKYEKKQKAGWDSQEWKGKLFSKTDKESKCPVSFLFKKKKSNLGLVRGFQ
tara:strand:+ start:76 stop:786 length:711 start_codon:yes stop_codon:yes gene_type:complete